MTQKDNWGDRARIGLFIVGNEAVPEAEWWAMAPPGVSVHAARVTSPSPWAKWNEGRTGVVLSDDLARGARQFATMRLSAVVLAHTTSSVVGGDGWDDATIAAIAAIVNGGPFEKAPTFVTTNGLDTVAALQASNVKRPFLVLPPWFPDSAVKAAIAYYTARGFELAGHLSYDPGPKWHGIAPGQLYAAGMGFAQEIEPLKAQILAACPRDADGLLLGGTGFRCVGILDVLEQELKRPVISANQASLWNCLRTAGVRDTVTGYGKLLTV